LYRRISNPVSILLLVVVAGIFLNGCREDTQLPTLDRNKLANEYYQQDAQWYIDNIPFFECSDKQVEQVYYYRWKLYKAHIRNTGHNKYVTTEFINDMHWDRDPYSTINAATMHHIYEGRWLKDDRYLDGYINYRYQDGGNNRQYSEGIADAAYERYLVNADSAFIIRQLDSMQRLYNGWYDHFDSSKNLYYIPAMPDATEYTIASIDASGGKDGFEGGDAFRPTINSYMYGNAKAIASIAAMKGDVALSRDFLQRAASIKENLQQSLWNDSFQHFTDRHQVTNKYVRYWDFIRGRELAGMAPWYYNLPDDDPKYSTAWKHVIDTTQLLGPFGFRTNEPSYQYYFKQFTFSFGKPGSQWNGPSWPYQSSQVINSMINLLNNYKQDVVTNSDFLKTLRLFTQQHYLPDGRINLVENYDPDKGGPIVYFYWSNHYNHSQYNNLIISGLCGVRPSEGDTLIINPLVDSSIQYFFLDDVSYHGHKLSVIYDRYGNHYKAGKGLTVLVDGKKVELLQQDRKYKVFIGTPITSVRAGQSNNQALNIMRKGYPAPSASVNSLPDSLYQAIDGRIWYFPEINNRWSTLGSTSTEDWFALDFEQPLDVSMAKIYLYSDGGSIGIPDSLRIEYQNSDGWLPIIIKEKRPGKLVGNTVNTMRFDKVTASRIRINFKHPAKQVALVELEYY
jgi:Trehalase